MTDRSDRIDDALARLHGIDDAELTSLSHSPAAQALFEEVVSMNQDETRGATRSQARRRPKTPRRRARLAWASAAAAVVVAAGVFAITAAVHETPTAAAVEFSTAGKYIVAMVEDPCAAAQRLNEAFAARGLDINLKLVPVSPSMVGSVVFMGVDGTGADENGIQSLASATRQGPGGPMPVGLRISVDFKGHAEIVLGRAARPGETYVSTGDAFAQGEALYKSGLRGMRVSEAAGRLKDLGLTAEWRDERAVSTSAPVPSASPVPSPTPTATAAAPSPMPTASPADGGSGTGKVTSGVSVTVKPDAIPNNWVTGAVPIAEGKVLIFTSADKPPLPSATLVKQRTLQALAGADDSILHIFQTQPDAGRPSVKLTFESWEDNADGRVSHERYYEDGTLLFEQAQRPVNGSPTTIETLEYAPKQNVYSMIRRHRSAKVLAKAWQKKEDAWKAIHPGQPLPTPPKKTGVPRPVDALRTPLKAADIKQVGEAALDSQRVLVLTDSEPGMHRRYFVDPGTYLPVRMVENPDGLGLVTIDYDWLPASEHALTWFTPPAGATEVPASEFPIRD
jgi:hypothetical protein